MCKSGQKFKKCCAPKIKEQDDRLREFLNPFNPGRHNDAEFVASGMDFEAFKQVQIQKLSNLMHGRS